jgi:hypothetical protein
MKSLRQDQAKELAKKQEEDRIRDEDNLRRAMEESAQTAEAIWNVMLHKNCFIMKHCWNRSHLK